ncbi:MAG: hypothetical protein IIA03_04035 [Proteobacteria bacterium]|jgi:hypothetical protein|nr:DUF2846 domain-containing protein [Burkholderiaceae bacterium]MCH8855411.1 hypothetical protein [Pseudomonadota bacterium]|mmetsp:Transcript_42316/g.99279  ORF Transcript_42316/g.99279 Transcript_42316/m.99279 type:complete len:187 (+) Transcript_42316:1980-2540(+)
MKRIHGAAAAGHQRRLAMLALAVAALTACAGNRPLEFAKPLALLDALPGHALVYLVRAPRDDGIVELELDGQPVARLPAKGYTAVQLSRGQHRLTATATGSRSDGQTIHLLNAEPDERRFFYLVQPTEVKPQTGWVAVLPKLVLIQPAIGGTPVPAGARQWQEMSEADAQGMLSIAQWVMPARRAY